MENQNRTAAPAGSVFGGLEVDHTASSHLLEAVKWGRILAIIGFVLLGLVLLLGLLGGSYLNNMPGMPAGMGAGVLIAVVLIVIAIYFYPIFALYKFSELTGVGVRTKNQIAFSEGMGWLKKMLRYTAILMIIVIALQILGAIAGR